MIPTYRAPVPLFHVFDLDASVAFYVNTLSFELVAATESEQAEEKSRNWAMLRASDFTLMLQAAHGDSDRPPCQDPARMLYHEDIVLYLLCADLETLCAQLRQKGLSPVLKSDASSVMDQIFVKDPDGYMLCFQRPSATDAYHP